jgi:hypothetical protein
MNNQTVIEGVYNIIPKLNPPSKNVSFQRE